MRFETSQHMKLGQQMKLAPRMIQSMEILQMPLAELEERVEQELENNVALELVENAPEDGALDRQREEERRDEQLGTTELEAGDEHDFERLDAFEASNPEWTENAYESSRRTHDEEAQASYSRSRLDGEPDGKFEAMANTPARAASLTEQLLDQWRLVDVEDSVRDLGRLIIEKLDDDGYLRVPLEQVAGEAPAGLNGAAPASMERALTAVQLLLEPAGIGARDARECLLLQLDVVEEQEGWEDDEDRRRTLGVARTLIDEHLDDLMQNRLPRIAEKSGLSLDQIKQGLELMKRLSLAPARRLVSESEPPITPDAIVEYDDDGDRYIAYLNEQRMPNLQVNRHYAKMTKDRSLEKKDRDFIRTNVSNAQWLIDAVNQRKHTLLRVINVVVDAQRDYFDYGPQALKPLPMSQVADQLGIHVATVSRAVADKYLLTPRGVVPLRRFFTGGTQTESGEEVSWDAIKIALKEVIDGEDKSKPLSDEALADALKERGIDIARRTVAKYRGQLGIQSARLRKEY